MRDRLESGHFLATPERVPFNPVQDAAGDLEGVFRWVVVGWRKRGECSEQSACGVRGVACGLTAPPSSTPLPDWLITTALFTPPHPTNNTTHRAPSVLVTMRLRADGDAVAAASADTLAALTSYNRPNALALMHEVGGVFD